MAAFIFTVNAEANAGPLFLKRNVYAKLGKYYIISESYPVNEEFSD